MALGWIRSGALKAPRHVCREWASQHGLSKLCGESFDAAMDEVCDRIGAQSHHQHFGSNQFLEAGLQAMDIEVRGLAFIESTPDQIKISLVKSALWP